MVGEMVQNSQIQYSFTFNDFIVVHEYIHSHSITTLLLVIYTNSHSTTSFLVTNIFIYIPHTLSSFTLKVKFSIQHGCNTSFNILCASPFTHHWIPGSSPLHLLETSDFILATKVNNKADEERPIKRENK